MSEQDPYQCSFCGKSRVDGRRLISGPAGVFICSGCVQLCQEIFVKQGELDPPPPRSDQVCSFCGKPYDDFGNGVFSGKHHEKMCFHCVHWYARQRRRLLGETWAGREGSSI